MIEKILVLGGKGGVGKSSISAATAVLLSDLLPEKKILLISFDMAHNLSDLLSKNIGNTITALTSNLWAIEPDPNEYAERYTRDLVKKMKTLMKQMPLIGMIPQIEEFIDTTFTSDSIPLALKNAMFFQKILDAEDLNSQDLQFDIIIADFPPTANMITLFEIPEDQVKVVLKYSLNFYNSIKGAMHNFSKMFRQLFKPLNDDYEKRKELGKDIFNMMVALEKRGERISELIHTVGSLRLVSIAEKPSFEEVKRARDLTNKYINLDAVHINMLIPKKNAKKCDFCGQISTIQQRYLIEIKSEFKTEKIWESNRLKEEPIGLDGLRKLAFEIYGESNAEDILNPRA
ncbi:MAG: TRC40/GET3/ArsA family transport-energizing ATPase [Candidatus Lokiarchaeota archaeon]|nr:TRC40/GET3/ArsA family transport-energizing ATPase [Candidatus Lokiarchaeota archaeon]